MLQPVLAFGAIVAITGAVAALQLELALLVLLGGKLLFGIIVTPLAVVGRSTEAG